MDFNFLLVCFWMFFDYFLMILISLIPYMGFRPHVSGNHDTFMDPKTPDPPTKGPQGPRAKNHANVQKMWWNRSPWIKNRFLMYEKAWFEYENADFDSCFAQKLYFLTFLIKQNEKVMNKIEFSRCSDISFVPVKKFKISIWCSFCYF